MSGWNEFCASVSRLAGKAVETTGELADTAALHLRLSETRHDLSNAYEGLGRLMYARLSVGADNTGDIDIVMCRIEALEKLIRAMESELAAKREAKNASGSDFGETFAEAPETEAAGASETYGEPGATETAGTV